jgi:DNA repair protein RadC
MTTMDLTTTETTAPLPGLCGQENGGGGLPRQVNARKASSISSDWIAEGTDTGQIVEALTGCKRFDTYNPLSEIAGMTTTEIAARLKVTRWAAVRLQMALELGRRMTTTDLRERSLLNEPHLAKHYLRQTRSDGTQERTGALYLNARNRLLRDDPAIYVGTLDRAVVEPREILKRAFKNSRVLLSGMPAVLI